MKINLLIRSFLWQSGAVPRRNTFFALDFSVCKNTEPTGPGGNIEGPKYFIKFHQTAPTSELRPS